MVRSKRKDKAISSSAPSSRSEAKPEKLSKKKVEKVSVKKGKGGKFSAVSSAVPPSSMKKPPVSVATAYATPSSLGGTKEEFPETFSPKQKQSKKTKNVYQQPLSLQSKPNKKSKKPGKTVKKVPANFPELDVSSQKQKLNQMGEDKKALKRKMSGEFV